MPHGGDKLISHSSLYCSSDGSVDLLSHFVLSSSLPMNLSLKGRDSVALRGENYEPVKIPRGRLMPGRYWSVKNDEKICFLDKRRV